jgi:Transglutaminase-like superfamily
MLRATRLWLVLVVLDCLAIPALAFPDAATTLVLPAVKAELPTSLIEYARQTQGRYAYGLYLKGKKVGWETEDYKVVRRDGAQVLEVTTESYFSTLADGEKSLSTEKSVVVYSLEGEGPILSADVKAVSDKTTTTRRAVRKDKGLEVTVEHGKRKTVRTIALPKDTVTRDRQFEAWLRTGPKKGDKFTKYSAAWDEEDVDQEELITYKQKKRIVWAGVEVTVHVIDSKSKEASEEQQVLSDGRPVTASLGLIEMKLEPEAIAKKLDAGQLDLVAATSVYVNENLGRAREITKLTLELSGLEDFDLPQSHRQKLVRDKDRTTLELLRDFPVKKAEPLGKDDRDRFLKATPAIQCNHEAIQERAKKIVGDESDPKKKAALLAKWVYRNLKKSYKDNAETALAVLDNKAGDCTEHSLLFVALARAVGLPAREVGGLAYVGADEPMFGWHAWAEIHDGRQWVTVDPTWMEVFVDATHIKLSEGSDNLAWVGLVGRLKIQVAGYEKAKKE